MTIQQPELAESADDKLLVTVAEHWMKARIDAPLAAIERLDQNAKQLLALAGTLQAVLVVVVKLTKVHEAPLLIFGLFALLFLVLSIACAARAIYVQTTYIGTRSIIDLLNGPRDRGMIPILGDQLEIMCRAVDATLSRKQRLIGRGMTCFTISLGGSFGCLMYVLIFGPPPS